MQSTNILHPPRFILQPDWDAAMRDGENDLWISLKQNRETLHSKLHKCRLNNQTSSQTLTCSDATVEVETDLSKFLTLKRSSSNIRSTFYAPAKVFGKVHQKSVQALDVNLNGLGISASTDGNLVIFDNKDGSVRRNLNGHVADVYCCRFFPSGLVGISAGADMMIKIWAVDNGACVQTLIGHVQGVNDVGFIEKGRNIVSCSKDGTLRLWDCGSAKCLAVINVDGGQINKLSLASSSLTPSNSGTSVDKDPAEFGTNDKIVALACQNQCLKLYALDNRESIANIKLDSEINTVSFVKQQYIVCGSVNGYLNSFDIRNFSEPLSVSDENRGLIWDILPHANGFFCSFGDGACCYRSLNFNENMNGCSAELTGPDCDAVYNIAKDEQYLFTCCRDSKIRKYVYPNV